MHRSSCGACHVRQVVAQTHTLKAEITKLREDLEGKHHAQVGSPQP